MSGVMLNIDDSHFFSTRSPDEMTPDGCDALVAVYKGTTVRELVFCTGAARSSAPIDVPEWETVYDLAVSLRDGGSPLSRAQSNHLRLHEAGIDPYQRWIARARDIGIGAWLGVRTNDDHHLYDENSPAHTAYWRSHPELRRRTYDFERNSDRAYNFLREEVRERLLRYVLALLDKYEPDGLELDWMRRAWHFPPGHERQGAAGITALMRRIRDACRKGSRAIALAVRVPPTPWDCEGFGFDAVAWAREGLVDRIAPSPDMCVYDEIPVELWKQLVSGTDVLICPGVGAILRATRLKPHLKNGKRRSVGPEVLRGLAAAYFQRGGDRIHAFNLFDRSNSLGDGLYGGLLKEIGDPDSLKAKPRRHVVTYNDTFAPGFARAERLPMPCGPCGNGSPWSDLAIPDTAELRIDTGPVPFGLKAEVRLAFSRASRKDGDAWDGMISIPATTRVRVNGALCQFEGPVDDVSEPTPDEDLWRYAIPEDALFGGHGVIEVKPARCTTLDWAEIAFSNP